MPKALKSCPKCKKSPHLVTLMISDFEANYHRYPSHNKRNVAFMLQTKWYMVSKNGLTQFYDERGLQSIPLHNWWLSHSKTKNNNLMGGSPGLLVMGGDSCSKSCGFKSWHHILDGNDIFTLICWKNCMVCLKRLKINEKDTRVGPFFKKRIMLTPTVLLKKILWPVLSAVR